MEIKTKFNYGDKVIFLYSSCINTGIINNIITIKKKEMPTIIKYIIQLSNSTIEKYEDEIFNNKLELLDSIKDKLQSINL